MTKKNIEGVQIARFICCNCKAENKIFIRVRRAKKMLCKKCHCMNFLYYKGFEVVGTAYQPELFS